MRNFGLPKADDAAWARNKHRALTARQGQIAIGLATWLDNPVTSKR